MIEVVIVDDHLSSGIIDIHQLLDEIGIRSDLELHVMTDSHAVTSLHSHVKTHHATAVESLLGLFLFLGLFLHAVALASIGLACSAFTSSQLVAAIAAWAVGFVLWDFSWASEFVGETTNRLLDAISLHLRYGSFAEGIVNLANLAYFLGVTMVAAAVARFSFDWRRVAG